MASRILVTGANKGLGREAARQLIEAGHVVWVTARDEGAGRATAEELGARFVCCDVSDDTSVTGAAAVVRDAGGLDVLVNDAGIVGARGPASELTVDDFRQVFETNVFGMIRTVRAFLPLLRESPNPVVVNVASGMGSVALTHDEERVESRVILPAYASSKAAVVMLTSQYAKAIPSIRINAVDPGYTATDLNGHRGHQTVEEGAASIVRMATIDASGPTGTFSSGGEILPW